MASSSGNKPVADWSGRVLVDATNRSASYTPLALGDISGRPSSEIVADLAPRGEGRQGVQLRSDGLDFRFLALGATDGSLHVG